MICTVRILTRKNPPHPAQKKINSTDPINRTYSKSPPPLLNHSEFLLPNPGKGNFLSLKSKDFLKSGLEQSPFSIENRNAPHKESTDRTSNPSDPPPISGR